MKKIILITIALLLCSVSNFAQNNTSKPKGTISCKPKKSSSMSTLHPRGGRLKMPDGIEGHKINFGFSLGGSFALIDALNKEKAFIFYVCSITLKLLYIIFSIISWYHGKDNSYISFYLHIKSLHRVKISQKTYLCRW